MARRAAILGSGLALLFGLLPPSAGGAADERLQPPIVFKHLTPDDGLSQVTVNAILIDRSGFLWFATKAGLNRYDSYEIEVFRATPGEPGSLSSPAVEALLEDRSGTLWVGTDAGLDRFDPLTRTFTPVLASPAPVYALAEDEDGLVWIGTAAGVQRLDPRTARIERPIRDAGSLGDIRAIAVGRGGVVWLGAEAGIGRFETATGHLRLYPLDRSEPTSPGVGQAWSLLEDRNGVLWVGSESGLDRLKPAEDRFTHVDFRESDASRSAAVRALVEDRYGYIWVATDGSGLVRFEPETGKATSYRHTPGDPEALSTDHLRALCEDRDGDLWIGTWSEGVDKLSRSVPRFAVIRHNPLDETSLGDNLVTAIHEDRSAQLWIGTVHGLSRRPPGAGFSHYRHDVTDPRSLSKDLVYAIHEDRAGTIWIGTSAGIDRFIAAGGSFERHPHPAQGILDFAEDEDGSLWVATWGGGIDRFDPGRGTFVGAPATGDLSDRRVRSLLLDRRGRLWIGTRGGLDRLDLATGQLISYRHDRGDPHSLGHDFVLAIHQDRHGVVWVGTAGGGLNRLDESSGTFTRFLVDAGIPSNHVYGILEDDRGRLWLSTNRGVARFDPRSDQWTSFDPDDGLQGFEFSQGAYFQDRDGLMFLGGPDGVNAFDPDWFTEARPPAPLVFTAITTGGGRAVAVEGLEGLSLPFGDNSFSVEFAALRYDLPNRSRYRYRMTALDRDWIDTRGARFIHYAEIRPGSYQLEVRSEERNTPVGSTLRLPIVVLPPIWKTVWFRAVFVGILAALLLAAYWLRIRTLQRRSAALEALVATRTTELERANRALERLVTTDDLTDLANHRGFFEHLNREWRRAQRSKSPVSLILADMDDFKAFNDQHGHLAGDECLRRLGSIIKRVARRPGDVAARYGGEEFTVLLPGTALEFAVRSAERIRSWVEALEFPTAERAGSGRVTISAGVACLVPDDSRSPNDLIQLADRALYESKRAGRNRVTAEGRTRAPG